MDYIRGLSCANRGSRRGCTGPGYLQPITENVHREKQFARVVCDVVIASTLHAQDSSSWVSYSSNYEGDSQFECQKAIELLGFGDREFGSS